MVKIAGNSRAGNPRQLRDLCYVHLRCPFPSEILFTSIAQMGGLLKDQREHPTQHDHPTQRSAWRLFFTGGPEGPLREVVGVKRNSVTMDQIHSAAHAASALPEISAATRLPAATFAPGTRACMFFAVSPMGLPPEVAKGTTVFPSKS